MTNNYIKITQNINDLNTLFFRLIKKILRKRGALDINAAQVILLYRLSVGVNRQKDLEQKVSLLDKNPSYNLLKMESNGYLTRDVGTSDKREIVIRISEKGMALLNDLNIIFRDCYIALEEKVQVTNMIEFFRIVEDMKNSIIYSLD